MSDQHRVKHSDRRAPQVEITGHGSLLGVQDEISKKNNRNQTTYRKLPNGQLLFSKLNVLAKHFIYFCIKVDFWTLKMH